MTPIEMYPTRNKRQIFCKFIIPKQSRNMRACNVHTAGQQFHQANWLHFTLTHPFKYFRLRLNNNMIRLSYRKNEYKIDSHWLSHIKRFTTSAIYPIKIVSYEDYFFAVYLIKPIFVLTSTHGYPPATWSFVLSCFILYCTSCGLISIN